ncbi:uncharacterized protein LOC133789074 [Humulus lupulus]|uniref:uncharacterized protein LOC133789074 n=1 Tax=Humulus lupulus TaxID=3486 RepID=UPI002B40C638|nr:uncharacterized protein LOC133789074 [Humulus lupulus]
MLDLDRMSRDNNKKGTILVASNDSSHLSNTQQSPSGSGSRGSPRAVVAMAAVIMVVVTLVAAIIKGKKGPSRGGGGRRGYDRGVEHSPYYGWAGPWAPQWASPPCPYPTQPPQWRGMPSVNNHGLLGSAPRVNKQQPQALLVNGYQPTDLPAFFNALSLQQLDENWYMDTGTTSHVMNNPGSSNGGSLDEVQ